MNKYLVLIRRTNEFTGRTLPAHRDFLAELKESGTLLLAGGFADQTGGAYILQCSSQSEAEAIIRRDPMNDPNEAVYELKQWNAN
ncbi:MULTISPECIES: YciI family protein [Geobacillus]|uniref:YCII-related domain-containing protein n=1 Tax=Geobacillus genomosp. 3 TaxID=1921421 RepID=S5ZC75_GEOG3|nr:YciI family protein [Geobacillus genomosp. 3]AGT31775.1 hypothetical protein M493_07450 [Geobacillus genomosp. 3]